LFFLLKWYTIFVKSTSKHCPNNHRDIKRWYVKITKDKAQFWHAIPRSTSQSTGLSYRTLPEPQSVLAGSVSPVYFRKNAVLVLLHRQYYPDNGNRLIRVHQRVLQSLLLCRNRQDQKVFAENFDLMILICGVITELIAFSKKIQSPD
jgi:hypothetical protein